MIAHCMAGGTSCDDIGAKLGRTGDEVRGFMTTPEGISSLTAAMVALRKAKLDARKTRRPAPAAKSGRTASSKPPGSSAHPLSRRAPWQGKSGKKAAVSENDVLEAFRSEFAGSDLRIRPRPRELAHIYEDIELSAEVRREIYSPDETGQHGIVPDHAIDNVRTNKTLYVDVKRQDGWVEGKSKKAGRGNVHERSCKYFAPGIQAILKSHGGLGEDVLPFWIVFQGDIARDPKRVREVTCWYAGHPGHFFMWRDTTDPAPLIRHFNDNLRHLLD